MNKLTAKNSFQDGLIMDFSPENTNANSMSSALNATLLTFNGNELVLQNDMGNGRVETARLPEGYMPVGTCEFGDIIYIVSYNPITNKSQIGCFPSPERNISSQETHNPFQTLSALDFQEIKDGKPTGNLNKTSVKKVLLETKKLNPGDKYIIYTNSKDNLSNNIDCLSDWGKKVDPKYVKLHVVSIEDSGKITYLDSTTKWYDIDNADGTYSDYYINYIQNSPEGESQDIDSYRNLLESNWSIFSSKVSGKLAILAELETIDTFSCSYELQALQDFDPKGWPEFIEEPSAQEESLNADLVEYIYYKLYFNLNYTSDNELIKPAYVVSSDIKFAQKILTINKCSNEKTIVSEVIPTSQLVVEQEQDGSFSFFNNVLEESSQEKGWEYSNLISPNIIFKIPKKQAAQVEKTGEIIQTEVISDVLVCNFDIIPAMEFGKLEHLKQTITIDFNKIGTGEVKLSTWKYHNTDTSSILTYGIEAYPEPGYEIKQIVMDFYDNQGLCSEYVQKVTQGGRFTEHIQLGEFIQNYKFSDKQLNKEWYSGNQNLTELLTFIEANTNTLKRLEDESDNLKENQEYNNTKTILSKQLETLKTTYPKQFNIAHYSDSKFNSKDEQGNTIWSEGSISDANYLYPKILYAVIIKVYRGKKIDSSEDGVNNWKETTFYRWFWTNTMYNQYYYTCDDYDVLKLQLELDSNAIFASTKDFYWETNTINNLNQPFDINDYEKTQSANYTKIGTNGNANLNMYIQAGLVNDYGCFNLYNYSNETSRLVYKCLDTNDNITWKYSNLEEVKASDATNPLSNIDTTIYIGEGTIKYDNYDYNWSADPTSLTQEKFIQKKDIEVEAGDFNVIGIPESDQFNVKFENSQISENDSYKYYQLNTTLDKCYISEKSSKPIPLVFQAALYNKAYVEGVTNQILEVPVYKPIISNVSDLTNLGIESGEETVINKDSQGKPISSQRYTRLYFKNGITLGSFDKSAMMSKIDFGADFNDDFRYAAANSISKDDNANMLNISGDIHVDRMETQWQNCKPEGLFFLTYPAWSRNANKVQNSTVINDNTVNWRKLFWNTVDQGHWSNERKDKAITATTFDVKGTTKYVTYDKSMTPFLSVKQDKMFYVLNSAYHSLHTENTVVSQYPVYYNEKSKQYWNTPFYDSFAAQLYLLLKNTYHPNCTSTGESVEINNIVTNAPFKATLTKNLVVKLDEAENKVHNILMAGFDFNYYVYLTLKNLDEKLEKIPNYNNVNITYVSSAKQTQLQVEQQVNPIAGIGGIKSYYKKGTQLIGLDNQLNANTFYVLQNNELVRYTDGQPYVFQEEDFKFDLKENAPKIRILAKSAQTKALKEAYSALVKHIYNNIADNSISNDSLVENITSIDIIKPELPDGEYFNESQLFNTYFTNQAEGYEKIVALVEEAAKGFNSENVSYTDLQSDANSTNSVIIKKIPEYEEDGITVAEHYEEIATISDDALGGLLNFFSFEFVQKVSKEVLPEEIQDNIYGTLYIKKNFNLVDMSVKKPNAYGFVCGLGLNECFDYQEKLIAKNFLSRPLKIKGDGDQDYYIECGGLDYYIDSNYKVYQPEQPIWGGIRTL